MGGNGSNARGGEDYQSVDEICGVAVGVGTGKQHNLPFLSPDGKPRIKLYPDGIFKQMRIYDENGRPAFDLDYHPESKIEKTPSPRPIFHYHKWLPNGTRSKAKSASRDIYEQYRQFLKGVEFDEKRYN